MAIPPQVAKLLDGAKGKALYAAGNAFNDATRHVFEREAASGVRSSHAQGRAALECLGVAERRLDEYRADVKRILAAGPCSPSKAEQEQLMQTLSEVMNPLMTEISKRGDQMPLIGRASVLPQLSQELVRIRKKCGSEFEIMLMESAKENILRTPAISITYNLSGNNSRVTHGVDSSTNSIIVNDGELFSRLQEELNKIEDEAVRYRLLKEAELLRQQPDKPSRIDRYAKFVELIANHATIAGYLLPALAQWAAN
jgi:hypothetical protein